jgi:glycosyl transferase family 25
MLKHLGIEGIYVVHAKSGYEIHENHVNTLFKQHELSHVFITDGDPNMFTQELLNTYFTPTIKNKLSTGVISCTLNHILSYEAVIKNNNKYALIFENDPFFIGDFKNNVSKIVEEANMLEPGFIISLENTSLRFPPYKQINKKQLLYPATQGRCAGAYLIDNKAAQQMLSDLKTNKCNEVIDWWHNILIKKNVIKMYWAYPAITEQGSHNGLLSSIISTKERSKTRQIKWFVQRIYKTYFLHFIK